MVRINWDWILSVKASALTDQEIEDLFPMVISCDVESVDDISNLRVLMKLSQEMLQHKDNQVESLLIECDDLKRKISDSKNGSASKRKKSLASELVNDREGDNVSIVELGQVTRGKNEKIVSLMAELELCEALVMLKKYENGEYGLAEAVEESKTLRDNLKQKSEHIEELVNVINKMEAINSRQEMEIAALCEKLNLSPSQVIPVDGVLAKHKNELKKADGIKLENDALKKENIDLKSDVRTFKYQLKKLSEKLISLNAKTEDQTDLAVDEAKSSELDNDWVNEREQVARRHTEEIEDIKNNVKIVVEENEALRKGMHEILDSVRDQDGTCAVEVQSATLERLLEALDVRHLAGWYHPAMRLQSRLNVVQGSNSELRTQQCIQSVVDTSSGKSVGAMHVAVVYRPPNYGAKERETETGIWL